MLRTPCDYSPRISPIIGSSLYLKKEHLSITGSYKERGALNKLLQLTAEERARGVICSSAGNHAQAVSYHSTRLGIDGVIVMPINAPHTKVKSTREFGARVVQAGESFSEAYEYAVKLAEQEGRTFIHAFNDPEVVAGQGTVAMELLEQNPYMDAVVVPVGGGGLIAGMALLLKAVNPRIQIYGVETKAMPGMHASLRAGKLQSVKKRPTMADGIAIEHVGAIAFDIIRDCVDEIVLVDEDEVAQAVLLMLEKEKTVTEGSGAAGLAALMANKLPQVKDKNVVCVVTGSNIDMSLLGRIIEKGLVMSGRLARVHVTVMDVPGQLAKSVGGSQSELASSTITHAPTHAHSDCERPTERARAIGSSSIPAAGSVRSASFQMRDDTNHALLARCSPLRCFLCAVFSLSIVCLCVCVRRVLDILRDLRANVKDIEHERAFLLGNVGTTQPIITIETRDFEHVKEVVDTLKKAGFEDAYLATPVA